MSDFRRDEYSIQWVVRERKQERETEGPTQNHTGDTGDEFVIGCCLTQTSGKGGEPKGCQ